jgi:hypothetical protein
MGSDLALFRSNVASTRIIPILKALGVPYRKRVKTIRTHYSYSFWIVNEADLEYIYNDVMAKLRAQMRLVHPDRENGNSEKFVELNRTAQWVRRIFAKHGVGDIDHAAEAQAKIDAEIKHRQRLSRLRGMKAKGYTTNSD